MLDKEYIMLLCFRVEQSVTAVQTLTDFVCKASVGWETVLWWQLL